MSSTKMFIHSIHLRNLLSFGAESAPLEMQPLNVFIGPNGSGKSNFLESISLLKNAPEHLTVPVREGGGIHDWLWKNGVSETPVASLNVVLSNPLEKPALIYQVAPGKSVTSRAGVIGPGERVKGGAIPPDSIASLIERGVLVEEEDADRNPLLNIRYKLSFTALGQRFELVDEAIENEHPLEGNSKPYFYYRIENGRPVLNVNGTERFLRRKDVELDRSILAQRRDSDQYPEITGLAQKLASIRLYREWSFGRYTPPRLPQKADLPNDFLEPDASNLGLVLSRLSETSRVKEQLVSALRELYDGISDFGVTIQAGTVQLFFHEGHKKIPATRLSDGTLRYLCLLAILCEPDPPPLICIEEPELGLHPDILPTLASLMKEASARTQLIVTTHSDVLVDAMSDQPESVVVCERTTEGTGLRRLSSERLAHWLEKYRLGELWTRGEIGGLRW